jgi:hypothetical protein
VAHQSNSDVERLRDRLNTLVVAVAGQFLPLVALYWIRFLPPLRPFDFHAPAPPPWVLLSCAGALVLPFLLPRSYFRPRAFARGRLYPALGVRVFRTFATDGDLINRRLRRLDPGYRAVRDRDALATHIAGTTLNERWHTSWLLLGIITAVSAVATQQYWWAIVVTLFNVAFNLYPVMHQRYKRARRRPHMAF